MDSPELSGASADPPVPWDELVAAAIEARERAHAPYSRFRVGAALWMEDGSIVAGCNVENRSLPLSICAERTALARAVAKGLDDPRAVVVVTDTDPPSTPCGMCREFLRELADEGTPVLCVNPRGERREFTLGELLPHSFELPPLEERS